MERLEVNCHLWMRMITSDNHYVLSSKIIKAFICSSFLDRPSATDRRRDLQLVTRLRELDWPSEQVSKAPASSRGSATETAASNRAPWPLMTANPHAQNRDRSRGMRPPPSRRPDDFSSRRSPI